MANVEIGTIIHGTMRSEDVLPAIMDALWKIDKERAREYWKENPEFNEALCDLQVGKENPWWESDEAMFTWDDLFSIMQDYAPEGCYFGANMGDGSDYGFWPEEDATQDEIDYGFWPRPEIREQEIHSFNL